jgi:hypothetical protein
MIWRSKQPCVLRGLTRDRGFVEKIPGYGGDSHFPKSFHKNSPRKAQFSRMFRRVFATGGVVAVDAGNIRDDGRFGWLPLGQGHDDDN